MNEQIRALFPITKRLVYLNHAAMSPLPVTAIAAAQEQLCDVQVKCHKLFYHRSAAVLLYQ